MNINSISGICNLGNITGHELPSQCCIRYRVHEVSNYKQQEHYIMKQLYPFLP
jgi:hypothetical protein